MQLFHHAYHAVPLHRPCLFSGMASSFKRFSSRDFQRGQTHENGILERNPDAVADARPAATPALSFSPSGARLFLEGHTCSLSLQSHEDIIMQFNLNTQSKLSG